MIFHSPFVFCLFAGIFASLAAVMFNSVRKEDIDYSPYEEGEWRSGFLSSLLLLLFILFGYLVFFCLNHLSMIDFFVGHGFCEL